MRVTWLFYHFFNLQVHILHSLEISQFLIFLAIYISFSGILNALSYEINLFSCCSSLVTHDDAFVQALRNGIPTFCSESCELADPVVKWDYLKYKVRQFAKNILQIRQKNVDLKGISLS